MSRAVYDIYGEVGDIKNRCSHLLSMLARVEGLVSGSERLTQAQVDLIQDANWRWAISSKDYVDRAAEAVDEWRRHIEQALALRTDNTGEEA